MRSNLSRNTFFSLVFVLCSANCWAQQTPRMQPAKASPAKAPVKALAGNQFLFGSIPLSTRSAAAKDNLEMALDQYENAGFDEAIMHAELATDKDPKLAVGYALWSFAARRSQPVPEALRKAKELAKKCAGDECLLITFLIGTQEANVLPAISAMNDLVAHRPKDKHVLYLSGEWLYFQQDYPGAKKLWAKSLAIDPNFPPALNMMGYINVEAGDPDPKQAVEYLRRYAAVLPDQANPQDSLGEVLRMSGDDGGSLAHYAEALRINPQMITSQYGRGDTYALMGNANQAKSEYEKALQMSPSARDALHIQLQMALLHFWSGDVGGGRDELAKLSEKAAKENDGAAQFEIYYARALLAPDLAAERQLLQGIEAGLAEVRPGMQEADRNAALAHVLREEIRIAVAAHQPQDASSASERLQHLCDTSRDRLVESIHESALGYIALGSGDFAKASEQLAADLHAPLVVRSYILSQEKTAGAAAVESAQKRLQYLRTPTAEWYVATHEAAVASQFAP